MKGYGRFKPLVMGHSMEDELTNTGMESYMSVPKFFQDYAALLGLAGSDLLFRVFAIIYDGEDDLKIMSCLPADAETITRETGIPSDRLDKRLKQLWEKGGLMKVGAKYIVSSGLIGLRDASVQWPQASQELFELWEKVLEGEHDRFVAHAKKMNYPPAMRVLPVQESVDSRSQVLDIDSVRKIFEDAELISALPCACRLQAKKVGRSKDCPAPENVMCMQTNRVASVVLSRNIGGKRITKEEALKMLADSENAGLVHVVRNNVKKDMFLCNCCSCCCHGMKLINDGSYLDAFAPSRFQVSFQAENCTGCGECVERCQFKAISVDDIVAIDLHKCYGCGNCVTVCPTNALTLVECRPPEHVRVSNKAGIFG